MRLAILTACILVVIGVFATMLLAIWSCRCDASRPPPFHQNLAVELVWAAIPWLIIVAAAIPAVIAISSQAGH
jgi:heme/copper-type cytochrome/quinol oxidase subunit 2